MEKMEVEEEDMKKKKKRKKMEDMPNHKIASFKKNKRKSQTLNLLVKMKKRGNPRPIKERVHYYR